MRSYNGWTGAVGYTGIRADEWKLLLIGAERKALLSQTAEVGLASKTGKYLSRDAFLNSSHIVSCQRIQRILSLRIEASPQEKTTAVRYTITEITHAGGLKRPSRGLSSIRRSNTVKNLHLAFAKNICCQNPVDFKSSLNNSVSRSVSLWKTCWLLATMVHAIIQCRPYTVAVAERRPKSHKWTICLKALGPLRMSAPGIC